VIGDQIRRRGLQSATRQRPRPRLGEAPHRRQPARFPWQTAAPAREQRFNNGPARRWRGPWEARGQHQQVVSRIAIKSVWVRAGYFQRSRLADQFARRGSSAERLELAGPTHRERAGSTMNNAVRRTPCATALPRGVRSCGPWRESLQAAVPNESFETAQIHFQAFTHANGVLT